MSNKEKEFELKFLPTKACLESRLSQEFSTDSDYVFAFFTEETEDIHYHKIWLDSDRYFWVNTSQDFINLRTGNSISAQLDFIGFPEPQNNTNSPENPASTISDHIIFELSSDKFRATPNDANGILLSAGTDVMYAGEMHPEIVEMWPTIDSFTQVEHLAWESIYLGALASNPQLTEAIASGTDDTGFLNLSNSDTWFLTNSEVDLLDITTNIDFDSRSSTSFSDIILEKPQSGPSVLGGLFLSNGTSPDNLILYASPFYKDRKTENVTLESVLAVSADFFTDIIIL
jgi:hypothetical protein